MFLHGPGARAGWFIKKKLMTDAYNSRSGTMRGAHRRTFLRPSSSSAGRLRQESSIAKNCGKSRTTSRRLSDNPKCWCGKQGRLLKQRHRSRKRRRRKDSRPDSKVVRDETRDDPRRLEGSLATPGWHPEETVPKLPQQDPEAVGWAPFV